MATRRLGAVRDTRKRYVAARIVLIIALVAAGVRLVWVQGFEAEALSRLAEQQRVTPIDIPAERGAITDRHGVKLALSRDVVSLTWRPQAIREEWNNAARKDRSVPSFREHTGRIADYLKQLLGDRVNRNALLAKLREDTTFNYLVHKVEPNQARKITAKFEHVGTEERKERVYPGGELASNVVGVANWRMQETDVRKHNLHGLAGLESSKDNVLAGMPGRKLADTGEGNTSIVIPGTERNLKPATPGSDLQLTIDADLQYTVQHQLASYARKARAQHASAVVMDAKTGEVYALANAKTFNPNDLSSATPEEMNNRAVTTPYEPGSVNKVVTAASAIEYGLAKPDDVLQVPGSIKVADRTVQDAWSHGTLNMTTTGVFAKSSNVGTLKLAQQVGKQRFADMLRKFGLGQRTGIGLPGESSGYVPPRGQWSGSTFGNLPIGQGLSMTVLQMAGMYQTIANNGVRVPPRIVKSKTSPDGNQSKTPRPEGTRVVSERTAKTVRDMLRAVVQDEPGTRNDGTAPDAAVEGYQISGKTGTAQQIDPATGAYSNDKYWITFSGIVPADDPRFVVGIMLDKPDVTLPTGHSAAPLFHDIAAYITQRYHIPLSGKASPYTRLVVP